MYSTKEEMTITDILIAQTVSGKWTVHRRGQGFPCSSGEPSLASESTAGLANFALLGEKEYSQPVPLIAFWSVSQALQEKSGYGCFP